MGSYLYIPVYTHTSYQNVIHIYIQTYIHTYVCIYIYRKWVSNWTHFALHLLVYKTLVCKCTTILALCVLILTFFTGLKKVAPHFTTVRKKIIYLPQNCKLSGNLLELEFCTLLGLSQFLCVSLFPVSVSLQGPAFHHGKPAISIHFYWHFVTAK